MKPMTLEAFRGLERIDFDFRETYDAIIAALKHRELLVAALQAELDEIRGAPAHSSIVFQRRHVEELLAQKTKEGKSTDAQ